jgi:hypothetical protein
VFDALGYRLRDLVARLNAHETTLAAITIAAAAEASA